MNKTHRQILGISLLSLAALSLVAGAYAIVKQPESVFVQRLSLPQMNFTQTTFSEAALALQAQEDAFLLKEVELTSERGNLKATLQNLGAQVNTDEATAYLLNFNQDATPLEKLKLYFFGKTLNTEVTVDTEKLKTAFAASTIEQGVKNAEYTYKAGTVSILPEQIGYGIDVDALTAQIQGYWQNNFVVPVSDALPLRMRDPEVRTTDLETFLPKAQVLATRTLTLQDEFGNTWDLALADHIDWMKPIAPESSPTGFDWQIDENKFITYVETDLVPEVEAAPAPAVITQKEDGTYEFQGSARFGKEIKKTDLMTAVLNAFEVDSTQEIITIPVTLIKPVVTVPDSLKQRGITELVGVGYSTYKSSPANRISNVNRGFKQFNGVIVPKGTEFSFTDLMGPVDAAHGWLPELVIKGDKTIPEYGGGMCQVSSTMFRAALYSGLPITERKNHSYAVSYYAYPYGYGLDATVYDPNPNLKFMNDTAGDILIQGYTDGFDAYFVFYGTYDGRTVKMEGPYTYDYRNPPTPITEYTDQLEAGTRVLEENGHTGFKVDWYRTIFYADGTQSDRETIHSDYEARPAKYKEGGAAPEEVPAS